jgi:polyhydroxybutyrate depolymerase
MRQVGESLWTSLYDRRSPYRSPGEDEGAKDVHYSVPILLGLLISTCGEESNDETQAATGGTHDTGGVSSGFGAASTGGASGGPPGVAGNGVAGNGGSSTTSGCGANAPSGVQNRTLELFGTTRGFVLSVPNDYDSTKPYPLVFAWHGQGGDGALSRRYFGVEDAAAGSAIFVYPDGLPLLGDDTAWDLSPEGVDVAFFDTLLARVFAEYCVDTSRIFSTGHSYGGYMTNRLGCSRANVLRGVASVAGGPPFGPGRDAPCAGRVAALLVHGESDSDVEIAEGERARDRYLGTNACQATTQAVSPAPCARYDGCDEEAPVVWCMHQGNHAWPDFAGSAIAEFFAGLD